MQVPDKDSEQPPSAESIHDTKVQVSCVHKSQQDAPGNSTNIAQGQHTSFYGNYRNYSRETE